ncbi:MAG: hypothetical protein QOD99_2975 [Chthoniobacter sp.]|jgi:hypothetical protein|nr:hypothetical protein [Chthoniobacter sp.]
MKSDFHSRFAFKGERDYVQGPDIHDAVTAFLRECGVENVERFDLAVHKVIRTQLSGIFVEKTEMPVENLGVGVGYHSGGTEHHLLLTENGEAITGRVPYREELLVQAMSFDAATQAIRCSSKSGFSAMETITSLNKRLMQLLFPDSGGKWFFARVQLKRFLPADFGEIEVILKGNLNFQLTRSLIKIDDADAGFIFFSLVR